MNVSWAKKEHKAAEERLVLLLQADRAYWFKVANQHIKLMHSQAIGSAGSALESDFSWLIDRDENQPVEVELILDTVMDELDIVAVEQSSHPFINRYRQWITLRRLRADYPLARVSSIPGEYAARVACLMHLVIPDTWSSRLIELQSYGVIFTRIVTGTQIVENWASRFDGKLLLVMPVADYQRHILIDRGAILALRTSQLVNQSEHECVYDESVLLQTVQQIEPDLLGEEQAVSVVIPGVKSVNYGDTAQNASHYEAPIENRSSVIGGAVPPMQQPESEYLIAMFSGIPVNAKQLIVLNDQLMKSNRQDLTNALIGDEPCDQSTSGVVESCRHFLKSRKAKFGELTLRQSFAWCMPEFAPSVAHGKHRLRARGLTGIAAICALTATLFSIQALSSGILGHRTIQQQNEKRYQLNQDYEQLHVTAASMHPHMAAAAQSLRMSDRLDSGYGITPQNLLENLGTVLTSMPSIILDTLIWVSTDSQENYESLTYVLSSVPHRQSLNVVDAPAVQQVEIAGSVSADTLNTQKRRFDQFVKALQTIPGAGPVIVLESPVDSALSSDVDDNTVGGFRLSFIVRVDP